MPAKKSEGKLIQIGYITKPHGLTGEVNAVFDHSGYPEKLAKLKHIFIGSVENPLPYFVGRIYSPGGKNSYLTVDGINDRTKAGEIAGGKIFIPTELFEKLFTEKDTIDPGLLIGFTAIDVKEKELGKIEDVFEMPTQMLAQVFINGKEALLPLNDATIVKIDKRKKTILLELPDGLLEVF